MKGSRSARGRVLRIGVVAASIVFLLASSLPACFRPPRWRASAKPDLEDVRAALEAATYDDLDRHLLASEIPEIPIRERLRPCCAFGADLAAKVGPVPVPVYRIGNILDPEDVGPHTYDSGILRLRRAEQEAILLNNESNGLVYTCRGGFIDIAHVRDYSDWATFFAAAYGRSLEEGLRIELPSEGGSRAIVFEPVTAEKLRRFGRIRIATAVAEWITFQLSIWHEIATWYGWSAVPGFSEKASAFSPEDLYSNLLGIKLVRGVAVRRSARSEYLYNRNLTVWLARGLEFLQPVPKEVTRDALRAVDGLWWDSSTRLPDPRLVLRRSFEYRDPVMPWLVPPLRAPESLKAACGEEPDPLPLPLVTRALGLDIDDFVRLEIEVDDNLAAQEPFRTMGRKITDKDFPAIIAAIREQNCEEFGPEADVPD